MSGAASDNASSDDKNHMCITSALKHVPLGPVHALNATLSGSATEDKQSRVTLSSVDTQ